MKINNLPKINKSQDIGDTLDSINRSFKDLSQYQNIIETKERVFKDFVDGLDIIKEELNYSCKFLEKNLKNYNNIYKDIVLKKRSWVKPLILIYPHKIHDNPVQMSTDYLIRLVGKWLNSNYKIKNNNKDAPIYVEGQEAIVYYLKGKLITKEVSKKTTQYIRCQTANVMVKNVCGVRRWGSACTGHCGCVDCAATVKCPQIADEKECFYYNLQAPYKKQKNTTRTLTLETNYLNENSTETRFPALAFIVDNCEWKLNNTKLKYE